MTKTVTRYTDGGPDGWMQSPTGEFVRYEDYARLEHDIEAGSAEIQRLSDKCAALAFLQYGPPREAPAEVGDGWYRWSFNLKRDAARGLIVDNVRLEKLQDEPGRERRAYDRGFARGSGDEGEYQRTIEQLRVKVASLEGQVSGYKEALDEAGRRAHQSPASQGCAVHGPCPICTAEKALGDPRAGVSMPFTHWSKDPQVPYPSCTCRSCCDARRSENRGAEP